MCVWEIVVLSLSLFSFRLWADDTPKIDLILKKHTKIAILPHACCLLTRYDLITYILKNIYIYMFR